ncbi:RsmE family RNA methyltransferase [Mesoaciditoga lauensis]|uniref:RsmE family RNA methyltransferase n=1 Tax=Mesoaciditoga lauensis TaxID=1495039 RepID=UPI00068C2815|nr:RsmE family RNA methyltransferase [Mesoaciditoga lauensis]
MSSFFFAQIDGKMAHFDEHEMRHIKVLRYSKNSEIKFTDGKGTLYLGKLASSSTAEILQKLDFQPPSTTNITIVLSPVRWERTKFAIEKAVELGANRLWFMNMERTTRKKTESKLMKMKFVARDAMKQCGSFYLPEIKDAQYQEFSKDATKILLDTKTYRTFKDLQFSNNVIIAVGPEGGFSERENDFFKANGFESVKMGKRILRTETAVIASLTLVNYLLGNF